ncbi:sensor histidine kinase [Paenibacillus piscarius]|uniref:sensor histidine kinase n=1 Tax=Paenibacillus piscarius TaxID=1089681 RepID=UPI001EE85534|nr:histidine kinase [Paenibacillus piscarius]
MSRVFKNLHMDSLRFKLPALLFTILIPVVLFLVYLSLYAMDVVKEQVAQSNKNMMVLYMDQIDTKLEEVNNYILSMESLDHNLYQLGSEEDQTYYFAQIRVMSQLSKDVLLYPAINGLFAYVSPREDVINAYNNDISTAERDQLEAYLRQKLNRENILREGFISDKWYAEQIGGRYYIFRIFNSDGIYFGAWVNVEKLTVPLSLIDLGEAGLSMLIDAAGEPMTDSPLLENTRITGNLERNEMFVHDTEYLVVGEASELADFSLVALLPEKDILANLPFLQRLVANISIGVFIFLPLSLLLLRNTVLKPLNRILQVMKRTRDGNIQYRVKPFRTSREFMEVNEVFNEMLTQIENLKINVYEEQLDRHKAELKHLQLQINPHFLMNSLNMIYSLSLMKKNELIQEMSICLVDYFRYMLRSNSTFVTLQEELRHVENYLRIQELRFRNSLRVQLHTLDFLNKLQVPPLIIQTFVENTVKHVVMLEQPILIDIQVQVCPSDPSMMQFDIYDTGPGYSSDVLEHFNSGEIYVDDEGKEHIGIWNMHKRLSLIYGSHYHMELYNRIQGGAAILIRIPLMQEAGQ